MKKLFYAISLLLLFYSCGKNNVVKIVGDIPNLPDGTVYLFKWSMLDKIDSAEVTKGHFEIHYEMKGEVPL